MGKRSYIELLKEGVLQEFDTTKTTDVNGPMLKNILSYKGQGELQTNSNASSADILERYYFDLDQDKGLDILEAKENEISEVPKDNMNSAKSEIEDEVEGDNDGSSQSVHVTANPVKENSDQISEDEELENSVLERLMNEMEDETEEKETKGDENKELNVDKELETEGIGLPGGKTSNNNTFGPSASLTRDDITEQYNLFREQVEDEDDMDEDENEDENEETEEEENKE